MASGSSSFGSGGGGGAPGGGKPAARVSARVTKVKNKAPAAVQITAEQLLREAKERQEAPYKPPRQRVFDGDEMAEFRRVKRKQFEDQIRKNRKSVGTWLKYAYFEENCKDLERARSVFERALDEDHRVPTLWIKYAEMEMKLKNINHARNIWDRAVTILPRMDQFWLRYAYMEEMLGNVAGARQVFERWMEWEPNEAGWSSYIKMEKRYGELDRVREIFEKFVMVHPAVKTWLKYAKFEEERADIARSRAIYERAMETLGEEFSDEHLYIAFARFETRCKEFERARAIYKFALDHIPKTKAPELYQMYSQFEKQYGQREGIEDAIISKRRFQYEENLKVSPTNYDIWFDYVRLEETSGDVNSVREVYERAIAQVPPALEKRLWRRYIYLWINYALFEELVTEDTDKVRQVFKACLDIIPHKTFTFAKIWVMAAQFEIRQKDLKAARMLLGRAIGMCPKDKLFKDYIELELQLREFDRCRILYEKFLEFNPANVYAWIKYAELEKLLEEDERCRAVFELAVEQPLLDMPELLWKAYIDFEFGEGNYENTRELYERLLKRTEHVKVWISYAEMEASLHEIENEQVSFRDKTRAVYKRAEQSLKSRNLSEERVLLLESWRDFELTHGDQMSQEQLRRKMPKKVKKRRKITTEEGLSGGWEEYFDYVFPADQASEMPHLKLLASAHRWKQQKEQLGAHFNTASKSDDSLVPDPTPVLPHAMQVDSDPAHVAAAEDSARDGEPDPDASPVDDE